MDVEAAAPTTTMSRRQPTPHQGKTPTHPCWHCNSGVAQPAALLAVTHRHPQPSHAGRGGGGGAAPHRSMAATSLMRHPRSHSR
jgi:hypothetical protein